MSGEQYWKEINKASERVTTLIYSYWREHSDWENWHFWFLLLCLLVPLIVLLIMLDRRKTLEILFYGYTVHMLWTYTDVILIRHGFIEHSYFLMPFLPMAFGITASLIPVSFLLVYQYCIIHDKNFIVWSSGISAVFAFGVAPIMKVLGLLSVFKGLTIVHLFFIDITISMVAYGMTKFFVKFYMARE